MKSHERMNLTPLEIAVWAAVFAREYSFATADKVVEEYRNKREYERQAELLADAKAIHQTRVVTSKRSGVELQTVRCSCGYEPPPTEGYDADEMMALHLAMVRAQGPGDVAQAPPTAPNEDRIKLWAHIVSEHANMLSPEMPLDDLIEIHDHEHDGPGTIRNHPRESREYTLKKLGNVLRESDAEPVNVNASHEYLASYSGGREVGCHICRQPRSAHPIG